jgi:hypothetical protein
MPRVAGIDADGMDSGMVRAAAEPCLAPRVVPERAIQLPRVPAILGFEEAAGQRAAPQDAGFVSAAG